MHVELAAGRRRRQVLDLDHLHSPFGFGLKRASKSGARNCSPESPCSGLRALELPQEVVKPIILLPHTPAFLNRRIALARQGTHQRPQGVEIIGKAIDQHTDT